LDLSLVEKAEENSEKGDICFSELSKEGVCKVEDGVEELTETTERMGKTLSVVSGLS